MNETASPARSGVAGIDAPPAVGSARADIDAPDLAPALPGDHPVWQRDVVSISGRARALIATLRPIIIDVLSFWDHRIREIAIGSRRLAVDPSGSYRLRD